MNNKHYSILWKVSSKELKNIVASPINFTEVLKPFNLENKGNNSDILKRRIKEENIDISHFTYRGRKNPNKKSLESVLTENCNYSRTCLKARIIKGNLLPYICQICGSTPIWNNRKLVLILGHINGVSTDNRLVNLRFVCPNCNSQLDTHCGKHKNKARYTRPERYCTNCKKKILPTSKLCKKCLGLSRKGKNLKFKIVDKEKLEELISLYPYVKIASMFGVSNTTITKRARSLGIILPNRLGYWGFKVKKESQNKF